jgi:hypothetical protein
MTTLTTHVGKVLCLSFLVIPSSLVEGKVISPLYTTHVSSNKFIVNKKGSVLKAAADRRALAARAAAQRRAELKLISLEAVGLSAELQLADSGLDQKVLEYALMGYHRLQRRGMLRNMDLLSICDFSKPSSEKRMYIIDVRNRRLLYRTYVAHGEGSGSEYASDFSNTPESHKSSLGFYVTRDSYYGGNGLSLRMEGLDKGFNSMALERAIVIHGAPYVSERILHKYGVMGTTFGCPAIPEDLSGQIIPLLKNGSCFFIYAPSARYLSRSSVLNG